MSDNDDDKLHDNILNEPIGTFPIDNTSDNIVLGNKYKYYTDEENAIKEAHQKNQEKMFKEGKLYPSIGMSPIKYGFGNPPRKDRAARLVGFRLDVGDDNSKLTKQDLSEGQANWNYRVMKFQGREKDDNKNDEIKRKKKGGGKRRRKSRKKYKKKTRKRRRKRKKRRRTRKKNRR